MSMKRLLSSLSVMNCAMAHDPESPSVECCEIIFPLLFASDGREQEPHSSCDVLSPAFIPVSDEDCVQRGSRTVRSEQTCVETRGRLNELAVTFLCGHFSRLKVSTNEEFSDDR